MPWFDFDDFIVGDAPTMSRSKLQPTQPTLGKLKLAKTSKAPSSFTTTTASSLIKDIEEENDIVAESSTELVSEDLTSTTTIKAPSLVKITKEDVQEAFMEIDPGTTKITTVSVEEGRKPVMPSIAEDQMMMDQMMMDKMMMDKMMLESLHSSHNKRVRPDKGLFGNVCVVLLFSSLQRGSLRRRQEKSGREALKKSLTLSKTFSRTYLMKFH